MSHTIFDWTMLKPERLAPLRNLHEPLLVALSITTLAHSACGEIQTALVHTPEGLHLSISDCHWLWVEAKGARLNSIQTVLLWPSDGGWPGGKSPLLARTMQSQDGRHRSLTTIGIR